MSRATFWLGTLIVVAAALPFLRTGGHAFINYDDQIYVIDNPYVVGGLTVENIAWAFRSGYASNWHPLTWLSHMLDCQLFGLQPGWHHLVNATLHAASALLLFLALSRLTAEPWPAAWVALLFAWHPTHVESVAWISERKDVLSGLFWFATILAYSSYAAEPTVRRYAWVILLFVLGLMAKPIVVTLPFVLLLLDYWPLGRMRTSANLRRLLAEKVPLFVLAAAASAITYAVQNAGGSVDASPPVSIRLMRAILLYAFYAEKILWPHALVLPYWREFDPRPIEVATAAGWLLLVTAAALRWGRRPGFLLVGWLWFLGTLVPVIGLVRVGSQAAADRYTYLPAVGIFIALAWGARHLARHWSVPRPVVGALAAIVLAACLSSTHRQLGYWRNSETLFRHALDVDPENLLAADRLAWTYAADLDPNLRSGARALRLASAAVRRGNRHPLLLQTLAAAHAELGQFDLALAVSTEAIARLGPGQEAFAREIAANRELYRARRPLRGRPSP